MISTKSRAHKILWLSVRGKPFKLSMNSESVFSFRSASKHSIRFSLNSLFVALRTSMLLVFRFCAFGWKDAMASSPRRWSAIRVSSCFFNLEGVTEELMGHRMTFALKCMDVQDCAEMSSSLCRSHCSRSSSSFIPARVSLFKDSLYCRTRSAQLLIRLEIHVPWFASVVSWTTWTACSKSSKRHQFCWGDQ